MGRPSLYSVNDRILYQLVTLPSAVSMIPALRTLHKRQASLGPEDGISTTTEPLLVEEPETGVTLGQILGLASLVVLFFYIIGISWKLFKIHRGVYVEEEPVFLKYK